MSACHPPRRRPYGTAAVALGLIVLALPGLAQQAGGLLARLDLSTGVEIEDSASGGRTTEPFLDLGLSVLNTTATQRLSFNLDGDIGPDPDTDRLVLDEERIALGYELTGRSTSVGINLSYQTRNLDGLFSLPLDVTEAEPDPDAPPPIVEPEEEELVGSELVADEGQREDLRASATLVTGRDAPFGTQTTLRYSDRNYIDTISPNLFDSTQMSASTVLRFTLSPSVTLRLTGSISETDTEDTDNTLRRNLRYGIGGDFRIDPVWTAEIDIGSTGIRTWRDDGFGGRLLTETDGFNARLALERDFRNGSLGLVLDHDVTVAGDRTSLRVSRGLDLANGGSLDISGGAVRLETGTIAPLLGLSYAQPVAQGNLRLSLSQSAGLNSDDEATISTRFSASYGIRINTDSRLSLNGSVSSVDVIDGLASDTLRTSIGIGYSHRLTEYWSLDTRLSERVSYEDSVRDDRVRSLTFSIGRSFSIRP